MSFVLAEGTYTTYAVYDSFDDVSLTHLAQATAYINCLETKAILITRSAYSFIKVYDIDTKTVGSTTELSSDEDNNVDSRSWIFKHTFLNTYAAFIERTTSNLLIYKNGVLLQTLTPAELGLESLSLVSIAFSPRGKYIFLTGYRLASGNMGWVVLKGT